MEIVSIVLVILGALICLVFGIQLLIIAFRTSVLWGLGYLLVPFVSLIFVILHWDEAKSPFLRKLLGAGLMVVGAALAPGIKH